MASPRISLSSGVFCALVMILSLAPRPARATGQKPYGLSDYSIPLCQGQAQTNAFGFGSRSEILQGVCTLTLTQAGGALSPELSTLVENVASTIQENPDWNSGNDPQLKERVNGLIRDMMDLANRARSQAVRSRLPNNASNADQRQFLTDLTSWTSRCDRGAPDDDCIHGTSDQAREAARHAQRQKWDNYVNNFLKKYANRSLTGAIALEKAQKAATTPPFNGLEILPMPPAMRSSAEGVAMPVADPAHPGQYKIRIFLNPTEDPMQAISTLAHEATHASSVTAETGRQYDTMNQYRPTYDTLRGAYGTMSTIDDFMRTSVCWADSVNNSCDGVHCGSPNVSGAQPCSGPGGSQPYKLRSGLTTSFFTPERRRQASHDRYEARDRLNSLVQNLCRSGAEGGMPCTSNSFQGARQLATTLLGMSTDPVDHEQISRQILQLDQLRMEKAAADRWQEFMDGEFSPDRFKYGALGEQANPPTGYNYVRDHFTDARDHYLPIRQRLSRDALVDEYRAHAVTFQTLADLSVLFPQGVCQRSMKTGRNGTPQAMSQMQILEQSRQEFMDGSYLCKRIVVPYTASGEGMSERDVFTGNSWNIVPDVNNDLAGADCWRRPTSACPARPGLPPAPTLSSTPIQTNCSSYVPSGRTPSDRSD